MSGKLIFRQNPPCVFRIGRIELVPFIMKVPFLSLSVTNDSLRAEISQAINNVLDRGVYILGSEVDKFELEFSKFVGTTFCVGVGNGFDALHLSLRAIGLGPGDEVLVPSNTYIATWLAISACGAKPVPVEPNPNTFNIDPERIEERITSRTAAIVPVHLYGNPALMPTIVEIARRHHLAIVEDCAQAHGATIGGNSVGSFGETGAWSFFPSKNLGGFGDGGAITTNDFEIATKVRLLRNYGSRLKYYNEILGFNSRLDEIQAAILNCKLNYLEEDNYKRRVNADIYKYLLHQSNLELPSSIDGNLHVWHQFVVKSKDRERLIEYLGIRGVETIIHYPLPPYLQEAYITEYGGKYDLPISDCLHKEVLSLPIGPHLTTDQLNYVAEVINDFEE